MCFSDIESNSDSDGEELILNFMALIGKDDMDEGKSAARPENEEDDDDLNQDLESEYKSLFDKFTES